MQKTLLTAVLVFILGGCALPPEEFRDPYPAPNNVISAFTEAWQNGDLDSYRNRILYDEAEVGSDGEAYTSFEFYFIEPDDTYGESWDLESELEHTENLFSGAPGGDGSVPGVENITLQLTAISDWEETEDSEIEGDPLPEGTLSRRYQADMDVNLKGPIEGSEINMLLINDRVEFFVIPVDGIDGQGYRLWKWRDISSGLRGTQETTWSNFKTLW